MPGVGEVVFAPYECQQRFMKDQSRFRVLVKARQAGFTQEQCVEAAWEFIHQPSSVQINISKNEDTVVDFHDRIYQVLDSVSGRDPDFPKITKRTKRRTEGANGAVIKSLTATPQTGRSNTASHWRLDEAAYTEFAQKIYDGALPTVSRTGGRVTIISTPNGRGDMFHGVYMTAEEQGFSRHKYQWWWIPDYNPRYEQWFEAHEAGDTVMANHFISLAKQGEWYQTFSKKMSRRKFREEYECDFNSSGDMWFTAHQLDAVFKHQNWLPELSDPTGICEVSFGAEPIKGHSYAGAFDLGRKRDATVGIFYDITQKPVPRLAYFVYIPAMAGGWSDIRAVIQHGYNRYEPELLIDSTGLGDVIFEDYADIAEECQITAKEKANLLENLSRAMDKPDFSAPRLAHLFTEHEQYRLADRDLKNDCVMANAMAVSIFSSSDALFLGIDKEFSLVT